MRLMILVILAFSFSIAQASPSFILNPNFLDDDQVPQMSTLTAGENTCTATLIGPRTIITAAHCINPGESHTFGPIGGRTYRVTLKANPRYEPRRQDVNIPYDFAVKHDQAIGILNRDVRDVTPMTVTKQVPRFGDRFLVLGEGSPTYKRQYAFLKIVTTSPLGLTARASGLRQQVTAPGDSGGPNVIYGNNQELLLFGVNSTSTQERDLTESFGWDQALPYTSGISRLFPAGENSFLETYVQANGLQVCGINIDCPAVFGP